MFFPAISPILLLITLLLFMKWNLTKAAPLVFFYTVVLTVLFWDLPYQAVLSAVLKSTFLSFEILIIVFGAIFFVAFLKHIGTLASMQSQLSKLSSDYRIQGILLAWLLGSFIEGISGFGTAGAIVAPFLVSIGLKPLTTIFIALAANCTAVTFGAVGTPVRIGLADYIGVDFIFTAAAINFLTGFFVPLLILFFVVKEHYSDRLKSYKEGLPWALFSGAVFLIPYLFFSRYGANYPSILGGAVGLCCAVLFLVRKSETNLWSLVKTFSPYGYLLILLIFGKIFLTFNYKLPLGNGISHNIQLFNPGLGFITVIIFISLFKRIGGKELIAIGKEIIGPLKKAFLSIFFISSITYLFVVTGTSQHSYQGILQIISQTLIGPHLPYYSAFIGAFGSFLAGSATVSNLLFGQIQTEAAHSLGISLPLILSLQLTGAAAGNMIALPNILAVQAAVGEENCEREVLFTLLWPCLAYLLLSTFFALLISGGF